MAAQQLPSFSRRSSSNENSSAEAPLAAESSFASEPITDLVPSLVVPEGPADGPPAGGIEFRHEQPHDPGRGQRPATSPAPELRHGTSFSGAQTWALPTVSRPNRRPATPVVRPAPSAPTGLTALASMMAAYKSVGSAGIIVTALFTLRVSSGIDDLGIFENEVESVQSSAWLSLVVGSIGASLVVAQVITVVKNRTSWLLAVASALLVCDVLALLWVSFLDFDVPDAFVLALLANVIGQAFVVTWSWRTSLGRRR